ncbi:MAG TPA: SH3 domain-containing protein [Gemmatimonadaceae bacterium]
MITALLALMAQLALPVQAPTRAPAIVSRARLDTSQAVNFRVLVSPDTVYVGQQTTYELGVFLDGSVRDRLRRMEAIAPEMRGMMAYEPPAPLAGFPTRAVGARRYEAHVYQRAIFPLTAGRIAIPPARLVYAMPLSYSFFSREESYEVRSDSAVVVVLDPPLATRPPEWNGAVGSLTVTARFDTSASRVGDPVLFTVVVHGWGNVKLFPRPRLEVSWASVVSADERVTLAADSLDIHGAKEFDWVITPRRAGRLTLPPVRYAYFDPAARRYAVAATPPLPLLVQPGALAALPDSGARARPRFAVRATYRGARALPPYARPYARRPFWWVLLLAPVPALALVLVRRERRPRARSAAAPAAHLRALAHRSPAPGAREVRRAFLAAAAWRLGAAPGTIAEPDALARAARRAGATASTVAGVAALLRDLDAAAFAPPPHAAPVGDGAARAWRLYRDLDAESRRSPRTVRRTAAVLAALVLLAAGAARAVSTDPDAEQFARGVAAYERGRYAIAERDFASVADRVPRAADAWANLGTAALAAGDTARAAWGWERALRLEPTARDVRDRLAFLGIGAGSGLGSVPPIPPVPLALLAAALWLAGWALVAGRAARRRFGGALALAGGALGAAVALGAATALIDRRLAARDLAVVARDAPLHLLPALGADRGADLRMGEVARVAEREGGWVRVIADGGREGWIDATSIYPLDRD